MEQFKAKVFISCGQKENTIEVKTANEIAQVLVELGFEPYIATQEHTLRGLIENIFSQLESSEYFLFVDFPREQFANSDEYRGSLFSHQELAIASYLNKYVIAFQQKGVKRLDGMSSVIQLNAIPFDKPEDLAEMVREQVKDAGWRADWKNALRITRNPNEFDNAYLANLPNNPPARFFHLTIENMNPFKIALNCMAYVERILKLEDGSEIPLRTAELKWAGYTLPTASIMPKMQRYLDAFFIIHSEPNVVRFNCFTDSGYYMRPIEEPGEFELDYVVISENFQPARINTKLTVGNSLDDISLIQI
jgi:hypothetical protein